MISDLKMVSPQNGDTRAVLQNELLLVVAGVLEGASRTSPLRL